MNIAPYIAVTDIEWFEFVRRLADERRRVDELNFWNPSGRPLKNFGPGEPVFLRLKSPRNAIVGYGFFAHFTQLRIDEAWACFQEKNGASSLLELCAAIGRYRPEGVSAVYHNLPEIGCTILRDAVLWPPSRWISWGQDQGWHPSQMRGATERDPRRADRLLGEILRDHQEPPPELVRPFKIQEVDERKLVDSQAVRREGQGTFRAVLLDAYGRRCSITGERTEPVLDAAHIQPYLGPESNHVQNGLLLTKEFHKLFDLGYVGVTPAYEVRISHRLRDDWDNGRRYYEYDRRRLITVPDDPRHRPSPGALQWHFERKFLE
jgi:putative restriction endonuclease